MATFDVLLPVRNGIDYLAPALDSIRAQTFTDWRLLILEHGSNDGSAELANAYSELDRRIEVHPLHGARGLSELLNAGLDRCDGKYVLRQDADDISLPTRMAELAAALDADPELSLVGSLGDVIDGYDRRIGHIDMPTGTWGMRSGAVFRTPVAHPAVAMRRATLDRLGARYGIDFLGAMPAAKRMTVPGLAEDYFMFGQLALLTRCRNLDRPLIRYRWHGGNVCAVKALDQLQLALDISRYLAESLGIMHGVAAFDPAPFCNHGERLCDMGSRTDFADDFAAMEASLRRALPASPELERELAFRRVLAVRGAPMAARYASFLARHGHRSTEWRSVKSWLLRDISRQPLLQAAFASPLNGRTADARH